MWNISHINIIELFRKMFLIKEYKILLCKSADRSNAMRLYSFPLIIFCFGSMYVSFKLVLFHTGWWRARERDVMVTFLSCHVMSFLLDSIARVPMHCFLSTLIWCCI